MDQPGLDTGTARTYSDWFRCLSDPSRILILNYLALSRGPRTVRDITETVGLAQSTVSHHLRMLADTGFVNLEAVGNATHVSLCRGCMSALPTAARVIMGKIPPSEVCPPAAANGQAGRVKIAPPPSRRGRSTPAGSRRSSRA